MKKILVVEGKNGARGMINILNRTGRYVVLVSSHAVQAVSVMRDTRCDLLITDSAIKQDRDGLVLAQFSRTNNLVPEVLILPSDQELDRVYLPGVLVCLALEPKLILEFVGEGLADLDPRGPAEWQHEIKTKFQGTLELPTISGVRLQVLEMTSKHRNPFEEAAVSDVARIIELDPPLSLHVIPAANRVPSGPVKPITAVRAAISRLGLKKVHDLAMAISFMELFRDAPPVIGFDILQFWHHSIACAATTQSLVSAKKEPDPDDATIFTAGILHDIGTLALCRFMPELFRDILRLARRKRYSIQVAEKEACGLTHAVIGGYLAQRLPLPEILAGVIKLHHNPGSKSGGEIARVTRMTHLVHIADVMAAQIGFPSGGDAVVPDFNPDALKAIGLTLEDIEDLKPGAVRRSKELIAMLPLHEN